MVQKKPPPPLRFGLRSMSSSRGDSGANTPTRRDSGMPRRRTSQQVEGFSIRRTSQPGTGDEATFLGAAPDKVYHPNQRNQELTGDDRKALGAQHLDDQLAPHASGSSLLEPFRRSTDSEDDEDDEDENLVPVAAEAVSETARGLIRWVYDNWYDFGWMIGKKGFDIGWSLLKYGVKGGPKKSWGIE